MIPDRPDLDRGAGPTLAPSPFSDPSDGEAALYFGHLAAQAEIALPHAPRAAQVALIWVAATALVEIEDASGTCWEAVIENLKFHGDHLGSWILRATASRVEAPSIALARREWLREEGRQILALADPFRPRRDGALGASPRDDLLGFATAALAAEIGRRDTREVHIADRWGRLITVAATQAAIPIQGMGASALRPRGRLRRLLGGS